MKNLVMRLWRDEAGFVVSTELILIATIVVIARLLTPDVDLPQKEESLQ